MKEIENLQRYEEWGGTIKEDKDGKYLLREDVLNLFDNILEFKSISKHYITGRGEVIVVKSQSDKSTVGKIVIIDSQKYKVRGVEIQGDLKEGKDIGLLVSKHPA